MNNTKEAIEDLIKQITETQSKVFEEAVVSVKKGNEIAIKRFSKYCDNTDIRYYKLEDLENNYKEKDINIYIHKAIYSKFSDVKTLIQTNSLWCDLWSLSGEVLPRISFLHSQHNKKDIPCVGDIKEYRGELSEAIMQEIINELYNCDSNSFIGLFIKHYGSIVWGTDNNIAIKNGIIIERLACEAMMYRIAYGENYKYVPFQVSEALYNDLDAI